MRPASTASVVLATLVIGCTGSLGGRDGGGGMDAALLDGGPSRADAGTRDSGRVDAGIPDAANVDAGRLDGGADAGPSVSCDVRFLFSPSAPETGALLWVSFTDAATGWPWIGLEVAGGRAEVGAGEVVSSSPPYLWRFPVAITDPGRYEVSFTAERPTITVATCEIDVVDTGAPPPLPAGRCDGRVCGDADGAGGTCDLCPMVGSAGGACMNPPSPIGPSGPGSWACLDSAGCDGAGQCRIWCPGEPCDMARHPDGCPQGVETCWVDAHITDYEEACRQCCRSRHHAPTGEFACWDDAYNICRYPSDCGLPYPLPPL